MIRLLRGQLSVVLGASLLALELAGDLRTVYNLAFERNAALLAVAYLGVMLFAALWQAILVEGWRDPWRFCLTLLRVQFVPDLWAALRR